MSSSVDSLLEILGSRVTRAHAEKLLADANGHIGTAIALHFSDLSSNSAQPSGGDSRSSRELGELRSVLGPAPSNDQLTALLRMSRGSVQTAIEMYLDNPQAGVSPSAAGGPGGSSTGAAANPSNHRAVAQRTIETATNGGGDNDDRGLVGGAAHGPSSAHGPEGAPGPSCGGPSVEGQRPDSSATQRGRECDTLRMSGPSTSAQQDLVPGGVAAAATISTPARPAGDAAVNAAGEGESEEAAGPSGGGGQPAAQAQARAQPRAQGSGPVRPPGGKSFQLLDGDMLNRVKRTQGPYPRPPLLPLRDFRRPDGTLYLTQQDKVPGRSAPPKALSKLQWPMLLGQVMVPLNCDLGAVHWGGPAAAGDQGAAASAAGPTDKDYGTVMEMALDWIAKGKLRLPPYRGGNYSEYASDVFCEVEWASTPRQPGAPAQYGPRLVLSVVNMDFQREVEKKFPEHERQQAEPSESGYRYLSLRPLGKEVRLAVSPVGGPMQEFLQLACMKDPKRTADVSITRSEARNVMINMRIFGPNLDPVNGQVFKHDFLPDSSAVNKQEGGQEAEEAAADSAAGRSRKRAKITKAEEAENDAIPKATKARDKGKACSNDIAAAGTSTAHVGPSLPGGYHLQLEFYVDESILQATAPPANLYAVDNEAGTCLVGAARGTKKDTLRYLASVIDLVLRQGSGLFVGPDCDGAINTGDVDGPELQQGLAAGPSSSSAAAGPSNAAGTSSAAAASVTAAEGAGGRGGGGGTSSREHGGTHNLDALLNAIQPPADLPQAVPPHGIKTHPMPFQLQGLEWLLRRERHGDAIGRSLLLLHPAWAQVVVGSSGLVLHVHKIAPHFVTPDFFPSPVGGTCGGFLCDEMGLGKSLQMLMLIAANPPPPQWPSKPVPLTDTAAAGHPSGSSRAKAGRSSSSPSPAPPPGAPLTALVEPDDPEEPVPIPTTLLVVPGNLKEQWVEEIKRHVLPGRIKWAVYRGYKDSDTCSFASINGTYMAIGDGGPSEARPSRRAAKAARAGSHTVNGGKQQKLLPLTMARNEDGSMVPVHECDLVLVTYELLRGELGGMSQGASKFLPRLGFWRIVLDEAQLVANSNSVAAEVASSLYRRHAWVVTGTPISSNLSEVQGLCQFLSYEPYFDHYVWRKLLYEPFIYRSPMGVAALRALFRGVMLRRSRAAVEDQLSLPPCSREDILVDLSGVERVFYDVQKARFMSALAAVKASGSIAQGNGAAGSTFAAAAAAAAEHPGGSSSNGASRRPGGPRPVEDARKTSSSTYHRAMAALVELRQCCCHPHIVKREALAARGQSARAAGAKPGSKHTASTEGSDAQRSFKQVMAKLVSDAYAAYDQAVAGMYGARIQLAALQDYKAGCKEVAGPSSSHGAAAATGDVTGTSALAVQLETLQSIEKLVSETDLRFQAKARAADGAIIWECAKAQTVAFGGAAAGSGLAGVAPFLATEQARERKRRWQRLQLDVQMLRCYLACLQAPLGTLQLLAAQAAARVAVEALSQAVDKTKAAADEATNRKTRYEELVAELQGMLQGGVAAAVEEGGAAGESKEAVHVEGSENLEAVSKATARVKVAARSMTEAMGKAEATQAAEKLAAEMATAAEVAAAAAAAGAAPGVVEAAEEVTRLQGYVNELRVLLGMNPVDLTEADTELRRSQRQLREVVGQPEGAEGAGGSAVGMADGQTAAAAVSTRATTGKRPRRDCSDGHHDGDDDGGDGGDGGSSSDEEHRRKKRARKGRIDKRKSAGAGEHEGALVALGGTRYQDALFRMETAVRTFQNLADRKCASAKIESDQSRLTQTVKEKWHALQHMLNRQEEQGFADSLPRGQQEQLSAPQLPQPPSDSTAAAAAAADGAAAAAGPSGSSDMAGGAAAAAGGAISAGAPGPAPVAPVAPAAAKEEFACPICLDVADRRTITTCGHTYCTDCIHDIVQGKGTAPCPICRRQLTRADLHDSVPDAEVVDLDATLPQELPSSGAADGEYGAKVTALLMELGRMSDEDPRSKALVFSSWGRVLRMVQEALNANGIRCASLMGGNPEQRQAALSTFLHDPNCPVLLLLKSTSGGAAGLTLTVAHTAFIMEPSVNPGLEAQAAARICRLGQDRPTRVVRIIARGTVEERVLAFQQHKLQLGEALPADGETGSEAVDGCMMVRFFDNL